MSQLMKRQLEHQSSAPHNISTWETGSYPHCRKKKTLQKNCSHSASTQHLSMMYTNQTDKVLFLVLVLKMNFIEFVPPGLTKTSLLSAPSTVSMFVPAPEDFSDEQPTNMADRWIYFIRVCMHVCL